MTYIEMTTDEAIALLRKSKKKNVLVAIKNLENDEVDDGIFQSKLKQDCEAMIYDGKTIASLCDDFIRRVDIFSERQIDLKNITKIGIQRIILLGD